MKQEHKTEFSRKRQHLSFAVICIAAVLLISVLLPLMASNIYYIRGCRAFENGEGEKAEVLLRTALFWDDDNSETYLALGNVYVRASQLEMDEYLRVNRRIRTLYSQPPVSLEKKKGEEIFEKKVKVKELTATDVKRSIRKGQGNAQRVTKEVIHIYPEYPGSRYGYEKKGVAAFRKGIALNPFDARLYHGLARVMQFAAKTKQTEAVFRKAVELDPNNPNIRYSFAFFYLRNGMKLDGINEMRTAVAIFPARARRAYSEWIQYGGSSRDLQSIAGASPTALWNLGLFFERKKNLFDARKAFVAACRSVGADPSCLEPPELPPRTLVKTLLSKLEHHGLSREHSLFSSLWKDWIES